MLSNIDFMYYLNGMKDTLYISLFSTFLGYVIGLPLGIILTVTDVDGICPNKTVYKVLDFIINICRSIPFLILMIMIMPLTKLIIGRSYGSTAMLVPLTLSAAPYIARMVESSLKEVDKGVIEAAQSMGAGTMAIVMKVLIPEARTSLLVGVTIVTATVIGYSAMSGTIGGGGLGKIAIQDGYYRYDTRSLLISVVILVVIVQALQKLGMMISRKLDHRRN